MNCVKPDKTINTNCLWYEALQEKPNLKSRLPTPDNLTPVDAWLPLIVL